MNNGNLHGGIGCGMGGCTYNQASDLIAETDPNATEFSYAYDRLSRRTEVKVDLVSPGSGGAAAHDGDRVAACVHCLEAAAAGSVALLSAAGRRGVFAGLRELPLAAGGRGVVRRRCGMSRAAEARGGAQMSMPRQGIPTPFLL